MLTIDALHNSIFVADDSKEMDNKADVGFPAFPGEDPPKSELIEWLETWNDSLKNAGYSALLRGQDPYEVKNLIQRDLITVPEESDAAKKAMIETKNEEIKHANMVNKELKDSKLLEMRVRVATKISKAMRASAPLRLGRLQKAHQEKDSSGAGIADAFDGRPSSSRCRS